MAENKFEFLGNDRYFKYRYANETPINYATITETWGLANMVLGYRSTADYLKRSYNIKVIFDSHKFDFLETLKVFNEPNLANKVHCVMLPMPLSFFDGRQEYFTPSSPFGATRTIIVSTAPKRVVSTSLSFLNMDLPVVTLMTVTVVLLAVLLVIHSLVMDKYKHLSKTKIVKKLVRETLENVWANASLLCAERKEDWFWRKNNSDRGWGHNTLTAISTILPHITCRLLASSWLIGVTFILFFLGCFLRTEFTTESYVCIDTLSDLIKSGIPPVMIEGTGTFEYLQALAAKDPVVQEWLDSLDMENIFKSIVDYIMIDGYVPIISGKEALIISDRYLTWFLGEVLTADAETKELFADQGGLYFSQQEIGFEFLHIVHNSSWMRSSPIVHEFGQLGLGPMFETQVFNYLEFVYNHPMEYVTWKRPLKSSSNLDLSSVTAPFYLFFILMSVSVAVVITEICFDQVSKR